MFAEARATFDRAGSVCERIVHRNSGAAVTVRRVFNGTFAARSRREEDRRNLCVRGERGKKIEGDEVRRREGGGAAKCSQSRWGHEYHGERTILIITITVRTGTSV